MLSALLSKYIQSLTTPHQLTILLNFLFKPQQSLTWLIITSFPIHRPASALSPCTRPFGVWKTAAEVTLLKHKKRSCHFYHQHDKDFSSHTEIKPNNDNDLPGHIWPAPTPTLCSLGPQLLIHSSRWLCSSHTGPLLFIRHVSVFPPQSLRTLCSLYLGGNFFRRLHGHYSASSSSSLTTWFKSIVSPLP